MNIRWEAQLLKQGFEAHTKACKIEEGGDYMRINATLNEESELINE